MKKKNNKHQAVGRHIGESVVPSHIDLEGGVRRIQQRLFSSTVPGIVSIKLGHHVHLVFVSSTFPLIARAVGLFESTNVQSWRSTGSASELAYHCYVLFEMVFFYIFHMQQVSISSIFRSVHTCCLLVQNRCSFLNVLCLGFCG